MTKFIKNIKQVPKYIYLSVVSFLSLFPFLWMIIGATNKSADVTMGKMTFGSALMDNINSLITTTDALNGFKNSLIIAVCATLLAIIFSSMAGYGFEIYKSKGKDRLFGILLLSMMIPFAAILIPLYRLFASMGMVNNIVAVMLPAISTAFLIFFFRQSTKSFPREILDAARVDGLNEFRIFLQIYFPTMKATYAAAGIITFMNAWNNFLWPLVVLQDQKSMTLPIIISMINTNNIPDFGVIMVAIVITTIPPIVIFFTMQKSFVEGMVGSVK